MEEYVGTITQVSFRPMVEFIPSELDICVNVPELGHEIWFTETGSIETLSKKFDFSVINDREGAVYRVFDIVDRKCIIRRYNGIAKFAKYLP